MVFNLKTQERWRILSPYLSAVKLLRCNMDLTRHSGFMLGSLWQIRLAWKVAYVVAWFDKFRFGSINGCRIELSVQLWRPQLKRRRWFHKLYLFLSFATSTLDLSFPPAEDTTSWRLQTLSWQIVIKIHHLIANNNDKHLIWLLLLPDNGDICYNTMCQFDCCLCENHSHRRR